eukprot:533940-Heterocapsa_arctica.AAC.1
MEMNGAQVRQTIIEQKPTCTGKEFSNMTMKERNSLVFSKKRRIYINGAEPIIWPCSQQMRISKLKFTVMECHV